MQLTEFGKLIRKARVEAEVTLLDMAKSLDVSSAFLSSLETGRKKVPEEWIGKIQKYFQQRGLPIPNLGEAADISNKSVSLEGLSPAHQMMIAGFARAELDDEAVKRLKELLQAGTGK